jgi:hypothetical protein
MMSWLRMPYFGSSSRIQPSVTGSAGRKNDNQNMNSRPRFIGMSVRASSQARKTPATTPIACRVSASEKLL